MTSLIRMQQRTFTAMARNMSPTVAKAPYKATFDTFDTPSKWRQIFFKAQIRKPEWSECNATESEAGIHADRMSAPSMETLQNQSIPFEKIEVATCGEATYPHNI
ncbi:hypothetical protein HDU98_011406 [Podochytrium sp. JEL0797]|nr:hypothetical protein HDU98_011404 [Podochytrium sp. JEL0797]KAJ3065219.1 hypothetical protein HDU98_011406 [Podochytrium sp. JEL0797]